MKILEDYKKIAHELLFEEKEIDDEKMIKYKDEDGESKEMKAGSAKIMPDEHPAKQAYNKMKDDGGDDKEKPSGQKLGGSDFDRDDTFGAPGSEVDKYLKSLRGKPGYDDKDDEGDIDIAKGKNYGGRGFGDDSDDGDKYEGDFEVDTDPKKYDGLESYEVSMAKRADKEIALHGKFRDGTSLPPGTDFRTKIDDLDEEEVEAFYDEVADKYAKKHDITMGVMDDNKNYFMDEEGMTMSDLVTGIKSTAEEAESEGGYMKYGESVEPKKKPFLREQLERFGGGKY